MEAGVSNPHPDLLYLDSTQKLGIEQARKIKESLSLKPYSLKGKVIILEDASSLTDQAQNSLLKTLEELPKNALFIMGAASDANFLPTILSRCRIVKIDSGATSYKPNIDIENLTEADTAGRFEYIEKLKDRPKFLSDLVIFFREKMVNNPKNSQTTKFIKQLVSAQEWAAANVNTRAILEYLMLVMPREK